MIIQYWSSNHFHHQWIGRQNLKLHMKCIPEWLRRIFVMKKMHRRPDFLWKKMHRRQDLSNKMRRRPNFLTKSSWVLCRVNGGGLGPPGGGAPGSPRRVPVASPHNPNTPPKSAGNNSRPVTLPEPTVSKVSFQFSKVSFEYSRKSVF